MFQHQVYNRLPLPFLYTERALLFDTKIRQPKTSQKKKLPAPAAIIKFYKPISKLF